MRFWWMIAFVLVSSLAPAQVSNDDVEGLTLRSLTSTRVKLTWKAEPSVACLYDVTYSVFRSQKGDFEPDESNRVIAGIKTNSVSLTDASPDSSYHVRSVHTPTYCAPKREPGYQGTITIHPITDDKGALLVSLRTKWRPETNQKGALSYIIRATYLGSLDSAQYYAQVRRCSYSLLLLDAQGFKIREIALDIIATTAEAGKITGLEANDIATLTIEQNRDFAQNGDWNLAWSCPK